MTMREIPGRPGQFIDDRGDIQFFANSRETDRYDSVNHATGAITAGDQLKYFTTTTNKNEVDTNIPQADRLVTGAERLFVERIGVAIQPASGTNLLTGKDYKRLTAHGYLRFDLNGQLFDDGPLEKFPSGYGLYGSSVQSNEAVMSLGMPSTNAVRGYLNRQVITDQHTVKCTITFQARTWLTTSTLPTLDSECVLRVYVHGILESAATNN